MVWRTTVGLPPRKRLSGCSALGAACSSTAASTQRYRGLKTKATLHVAPLVLSSKGAQRLASPRVSKEVHRRTAAAHAGTATAYKARIRRPDLFTTAGDRARSGGVCTQGPSTYHLHSRARAKPPHISLCCSFVRRVRLHQPGVLQRLRRRRACIGVERQQRLNERAKARVRAAKPAA